MFAQNLNVKRSNTLSRQLKVMEYNLNLSDISLLNECSDEALSRFDNVDNPDFYEAKNIFITKLPQQIRLTVSEFKKEASDVLVIRGYPFDDKLLGSTPPHWNVPKSDYARKLQFINFFIAAQFGYPYSWKTQNGGSFVSDVLPIQGFEEHQQGYGSNVNLRFHTEDSFHIARADFLTLMCMRNDSRTPTTLFPIQLDAIPDEYKRELFKEQYEIYPDDSHTEVTYTEKQYKENTDLQKTFETFNKIRKISILRGQWNNPYLQLDPEIMPTENLTTEAKAAFDYICEKIEESRTGLALNQGEILIINNHLLAHGRGKFKANYDGRDRWMERILVLEDLRKTVSHRTGRNTHMIVR
ncbi:MAG: TauD/TfdA family dioxygenase [Alphaproteobacteria bacterium]|nr:MAG: TauD/TfdA family dioxygenase [Alphaproteobacteria bacterium]